MNYGDCGQRHGEADCEWDGVPPNPCTGWHLLRRKPSAYIKSIRNKYEEVYHYDAGRALPWERRDDCLRKGYSLRWIAREWEYVGRLVLEPAS